MSDALRPAGDRWALHFERRFAHPPEKVWRAITEPRELSRWYPFAVEDVDLRVGGAIRFRDPDGDAPSAEITRLDPPRALAFEEADEETGTHALLFELRPDGDGCLLRFTHTFADRTWAEQTETGWLRCLDALGDAVAEPEEQSA